MNNFYKICESIVEFSAVRAKLLEEFWYLAYETDETEIWRHRDDPSIGEYIINYNDGSIIYRNPIHKMFNRKFNSFNDFSSHLDEIMFEPDFDIEKGRKFLQQIADELKKKKKP